MIYYILYILYLFHIFIYYIFKLYFIFILCYNLYLQVYNINKSKQNIAS